MTRALLFPGQGPQEPAMLLARRTDPVFEARYATLVEVIGRDPIAELAAQGPEVLRENVIASAVTVLASVVELERLSTLSPRDDVAAMAGYSVGQWTALHAAGMLSYEDTLRVVARRAALMDASDAVKDGAMLAVIGLPTERVAEVCSSVRAGGDHVEISNFNCLGQLSLAGTRRGIERAEAVLTALAPRKLARVPVAGAWHSALLTDAAARFRALLDDVALAAPRVPVMDNVTGEALPADPRALRDTLAAHVCSPVRWEACVRSLIATSSADTLIEVGFGDMLTKFGFFIDRSRRHLPSSKVQ